MNSSAASKKLRDIFWGHTIYYSLGILFLFCGLALLFRLQNLVAVHQETRKIRVHSILTFIALILFFVLCCTDQVTAVTIFALPILAGLFLERLMDRKTPLLHWKNTRALLLLLSLGIAVVSGMELGNIWGKRRHRGLCGCLFQLDCPKHLDRAFAETAAGVADAAGAGRYSRRKADVR